MGLWEERIESSPAWASLTAAEDRIAELAADHPGADGLNRPQQLFAITEARLRGLDPVLASAAVLGDLGARIDALVTAVVAHLDPAAGQEPTPSETIDGPADHVAESLAALGASAEEEQRALIDSLRDQIAGMAERIGQLIAAGDAEVKRSVEDQVAVLAERQAEAARIEQKIAEMDTQLAALSTAAEEFIGQRTTAATEAANAAEAQHSRTRTQAEERISKLIESTEAEIERAETARSDTHSDLISKLESNGNEQLVAIEKLKTQAENLVGAVARTSKGAGYLDWEDTEQKRANWMRRGSILFGTLAALAVLGLVIARVWHQPDQDIGDLGLAVATLTIPGAFGAVALYLGRESSAHRRNAVIARRTELDIHALGPYIAELTEEEQAVMLVTFAPEFFGRASAHLDRKGVGDGPKPPLREGIERVIGLIRARPKPDDPQP